MILLVWSSDRAKECAIAIETALQECAQVAGTLRQATEQLRLQEYSAVVLDQGMCEVEPDAAGVLFEHLGPAIPVFVNFAVTGVDRVLRELRAALARRGREIAIARHAACRLLRNELSDDLTALLLCCGVVVSDPCLTDTARVRVLQIHQLTEQIRTKLALAQPENAVVAGNS